MIAKPTPVQSTAYDLRRADGSIVQGLTPKQIREMAMANDLYTDDMICRTGDDRWRFAATLSGLPIRTRPEISAPPVIEAIPEAIPETIPDPRIAQADHRAEQLQTACDRLLIERDELLHQEDQSRSENERLARESDDLQRRCTDLAAEVAKGSQLQQTIVELLHQEDQSRSENERLARESDDLQRRCTDLAAEVARGSQLQQTIAELRRENSALEQVAREKHEAHDSQTTQLRAQVWDLSEEVRRRLDPAVGVALDEAVRERDLAQQHVQEAIVDRDELMASLGHSQDALRVADDLRRALEKSVTSLKSTASEHAAELTQTRIAVAESRSAYAALIARTEVAEAAVSRAQHAQIEANASIVRATEQRDAALKARDTTLAERDAAVAERDSTRLAVGATQTDLVRVRREFDAMRSDYDSACAALSEQTARAAGLESAIATMRSQNQDLTADRNAGVEEVAHLNEEIERSTQQMRDQSRRNDDLQQRLGAIETLAGEMEVDRDTARTEAAALHGALAAAREAVALESQRHTELERELAQERSRIVARDELIFRESLRSEERETENRKLRADIAALRADCETERRRADDATAQIVAVQRDLQAAHGLTATQNAEMIAAHKEIENLTNLEQSARASLTAASRERDELATALATAHAAVASREQQVSAERGLREQAEGSSRQLLTSYEKLAEETGRRITDLEIKLSETNHNMQAVRIREEQLIASLAEAHSQAKLVAHKLASVEEQRTAMTRDRDSHAKRAATETSARAAAEDKITAANERAAKAERDARSTHERAVQTAMIALNGSKQRLDEDYAQSRSEIDVLEQLVAESSKRLIASGGTLPGMPLLPREASAKIAADAKAAADAKTSADAAALHAAHVIQQAALQAAQPLRSETPTRPIAPPINFRMIDGGVDDTTLSRPQTARTTSATNTPGRQGGQRERVSQPRAQSSSSSDDDSSSTSDSPHALPPPQKPTAAQRGAAQPAASRRTSSGPVLDDAWIDDHCASDVAENAPRVIGLVAITALGIAITATISAIPEFHALDMRAAFTRIAAWVIAVPTLVAIVHLITTRCEPILARRIPILAAVMLSLVPLSTFAFGSAPWIGIVLVGAVAALPWMMSYAAWPDAKQVRGCRTNDLIVGMFARRTTVASLICAALAIIGSAATVMPWTIGSPSALSSPTGGFFVILLGSLIAAVLTPSLRSHAPLAAWSALAVVTAFLGATCASQGITLALTTIAPAAWIALFAAWSAIAASSLAAAHSPQRIADAIQSSIDDDAPALVAHERIHAAHVMALTAFLPILPALTAFHLVRGRSRRAESQLRSLANFELWFAVVLAISIVIALIFPAQVGSSILLGLLAAHAAICLGAAITIGADRFVRFPSPAALLARPGGGLDLPLPLITVQRTAEQSPHKPIVHPCGTTTWGAITVALGCLSVASVTRNPALALALGPILGLAVWLPSLIASRCRHQDTLVLSGLATAMIAVVICAGFVLEIPANPDAIPMLVAIAGAATGVWALLVGWAFKGMTQLATLARGTARLDVDDFGEAIAPMEHPLAYRRRETLMRRVVIGASGVTAASILVAVLPSSTPIIVSPLLICGALSLALATIVWLTANLCDRSRLVQHAGLFTAMLVTGSFFAALPLFFRATEVGALAALGALPFCAIAAIAALLTAGIINTLREPKSTIQGRKATGPCGQKSTSRGRFLPARVGVATK